METCIFFINIPTYQGLPCHVHVCNYCIIDIHVDTIFYQPHPVDKTALHQIIQTLSALPRYFRYHLQNKMTEMRSQEVTVG